MDILNFGTLIYVNGSLTYVYLLDVRQVLIRQFLYFFLIVPSDCSSEVFHILFGSLLPRNLPFN